MNAGVRRRVGCPDATATRRRHSASDDRLTTHEFGRCEEGTDAMTMRVAEITACIVTVAASAAIGAPTAIAGPTGLRPNPPGEASRQSATPTPAMSRQPHDLPPIDHSVVFVRGIPRSDAGSGFDWAAAAVGALAAACASIVLIGSVLGIRRRHAPTAA